MLVLEAFAPSHADNPSDEWQLALFFDVQTPTQIRDLAPLSNANPASTPSRVPVTIPGCSAQPVAGGPLLCPLSAFLDRVARVVRPECITPPPLKAFVDSLGGGGGGGARCDSASPSPSAPPAPSQKATADACALVTAGVGVVLLAVGFFTGRLVPRRGGAQRGSGTRDQEAELAAVDAGSDSDVKPLV